jgi:HAD superfamily hydrolase (TIGR02253 family)
VRALIRGVVFDLDNTLNDFMRMKEASVDMAIEAMQDAGLIMDSEEAKTAIYSIYDRQGIEYQKVFNHFLEEHLGKVDYKILAAGIVGYRRAREASLVLYPRVMDTLNRLLRRGLKLAVVSDAPVLEAWLRLCNLGLQHTFEAVITFNDTQRRKPDPAPFQAALDQLGLAPKETIMVGDWAERDIVGAAKLGMITAFARYGDTFNTKTSGADYELNDISDLVGLIDELNQEPATRS